MSRLLLFFFLIPFLGYAQDSINRSDGNGFKQGFWRKTGGSGNVIYEGRFRDNLPIGEFRYFYPDGKIKTTMIYRSGSPVAYAVSYFPNGKKMAEGKYLSEKRDSVWQFYSETTGNLVSEEPYENGVVHGVAKIYLLKGGLAEIVTWDHGVREGLWEQYYTGGAVKTRCYFHVDEKEGPFQAFSPDGVVMVEGQYHEGHQDGIWNFYNEKGLPEKRETWKMGKLIKTEDQLEKTR